MEEDQNSITQNLLSRLGNLKNLPEELDDCLPKNFQSTLKFVNLTRPSTEGKKIMDCLKNTTHDCNRLPIIEKDLEDNKKKLNSFGQKALNFKQDQNKLKKDIDYDTTNSIVTLVESATKSVCHKNETFDRKTLKETLENNFTRAFEGIDLKEPKKIVNISIETRKTDVKNFTKNNSAIYEKYKKKLQVLEEICPENVTIKIEWLIEYIANVSIAYHNCSCQENAFIHDKEMTLFLTRYDLNLNQSFFNNVTRPQGLFYFMYLMNLNQTLEDYKWCKNNMDVLEILTKKFEKWNKSSKKVDWTRRSFDYSAEIVANFSKTCKKEAQQRAIDFTNLLVDELPKFIDKNVPPLNITQHVKNIISNSTSSFIREKNKLRDLSDNNDKKHIGMLVKIWKLQKEKNDISYHCNLGNNKNQFG